MKYRAKIMMIFMAGITQVQAAVPGYARLKKRPDPLKLDLNQEEIKISSSSEEDMSLHRQASRQFTELFEKISYWHRQAKMTREQFEWLSGLVVAYKMKHLKILQCNGLLRDQDCRFNQEQLKNPFNDDLLPLMHEIARKNNLPDSLITSPVNPMRKVSSVEYLNLPVTSSSSDKVLENSDKVLENNDSVVFLSPLSKIQSPESKQRSSSSSGYYSAVEHYSPKGNNRYDDDDF